MTSETPEISLIISGLLAVFAASQVGYLDKS